MKKELLKLLKEYYYYKSGSAGFISSVFTRNKGMDFYDFIEWLDSHVE